MHVTELEAASMYARACRAWYGRRAQKVVKDEIKRLRTKNDEADGRWWRNSCLVCAPSGL
jgi:hypothetical protein